MPAHSGPARRPWRCPQSASEGHAVALPGCCRCGTGSARPRHDPPRPARALVDERGVGLQQGRAGVEPGPGVLGRGDAADADQREPGPRPGPLSSRSTSSGARRRAAGRTGRRRRSARPPRRAWLRPSRVIVVLVAMIAVETERRRQVGDGQHVVVGQVRRDLDQQRHPAVGDTCVRAAAYGRQQRLQPLHRLQGAQPGGVGRGDVDDQVVGVRRQQPGALLVVGLHRRLVVLRHHLRLPDVHPHHHRPPSGASRPSSGASWSVEWRLVASRCATTSAPSLLKPIRLTMARSAGSRNSRGVGLPGCGSRGHGADLDVPEPERGERVDADGVLVEAGGEPEHVGEGQAERLHRAG